MTVTVLLAGERHQVRAINRVWRAEPPDSRVAITACGETVALAGEPFDPTSAYQRAVFPLAAAPVPCPRCPA